MEPKAFMALPDISPGPGTVLDALGVYMELCEGKESDTVEGVLDKREVYSEGVSGRRR